ncbi:PaaI family thioesterase [Haloarchaeobius sp. HME9146]|uniref:PaaI family thioesterase n=1 Tax=Haloarchaeobius sp. HME9146 TaxID=2978732 RepID=UPI0021C1A878|nr:PaaI family thioesterase [Haloarchaeobius sp. HME9146]MCT9095496.1 PaaI family thioesterase [Haloarchaeobius sp. HME9146]
MTVADIFDAMPYADLLGIEITEVEDGFARGSLELGEEHSSVPGRSVAHGGVVHSLADHVGGAAIISLVHRPTPTIDIRIDHLSPATDDLVAEAEVVRNGGNVATVDVTVEDVSGHTVATARAVYKTNGGDGGSAWMGEREEFPTEE